MWSKWSALWLALALVSCRDEEAKERPAVVVIAPLAGNDVGLDDAVLVLGETLAKMGHVPAVMRVAGAEAAAAALAQADAKLVLVVDAGTLGLGGALDAAVPGAGAFDDRFALEVSRPDSNNPIDAARGTLVVALDGKSRLARFYAVYELLRRLGARYFHPEDEWIPQVPAAQLTRRAERPTVLGPGPVFAPDFGHRSFSFHGAHPLEHLEAFSDGRHPIDEALRVNDWIIKNRGDLPRGPGRGIAPAAEAAERAAELDALRVRRGFRRQTGITLHNQQQGSAPDIDPAAREPVADQIARIVKSRLEAAPDVYGFGIHFGPTELTTTPDRETVEWIDLAGRAALALRPDLQIEVNDHATGSQPTEHFDDLGCAPGTNDDGVGDYYDLAFHTDPRFAARVHTVMFHPLEGPARVYQQVSFAHKLCLMQKASAAGRPLVYFPEGSYWLSWDNAVPVYLPLYILTRQRDLELLRPLLVKNGGTLRDHRMFNSGHEWGYWQQDYAVGLLHWRADLPLEEVLGEMADPLCDADHYRDCPARTAYVEVMMAVMQAERDAFLDAEDFRGRPGGLYTYFAGEDAADELGARSGLEFRPVRLAFRDVLGLSSDELERFVANDLGELGLLDAFFTTHAARLAAVKPEVPEDGQRWLAEVIDGLEVNALRARHTRALYLAVVALRDHDAASDEVQRPFAEASAAFDATAAVIARREAAYRYPLPQLIGGGVTPETQVANGTTFPYRVHTKTHLMTYWSSRAAQVLDLIDGQAGDDDGVALRPVFAGPEIPVTLTWPALEGLTGALDMGDEASVAAGTAEHAYAGAGIYRVSGLLESSGAPLPVNGVVARVPLRFTCDGGFVLQKPDSALARSVLASLVPALRLAVDAPEGAAEGAQVALLAEPGGIDSGRFDEVVVVPAIVGAQSIEAGPFDFTLPIPDPASGVVAARVGLSQATLTLAREGAESAALTGELSLPDLVAALVALAGFDAAGATETLAGVLGFDPAAPPETVPFEATLTLTRDAP